MKRVVLLVMAAAFGLAVALGFKVSPALGADNPQVLTW